MKNPWILAGGMFGFLGVALGAFGAHGLKESLTPEMLEIYKTGVLYHLIHSIAILTIGLYGNIKLYKSALFFSIGIVLFSFSMYIYSITLIKALAMITPAGGVCFLIGWLMIVITALKLRKEA